jgi:ankyrin repeat protein
MAAFLLKRGSPVDVRSAEGATPLMTEAQSGNIAKIQLLLDAGADVNAADSRGFNSLHRAAEMGKVDVVELLLKHGARTDVSVEGHTALSFAEKRGHTEIARMLKPN